MSVLGATPIHTHEAAFAQDTQPWGADAIVGRVGGVGGVGGGERVEAAGPGEGEGGEVDAAHVFVLVNAAYRASTTSGGWEGRRDSPWGLCGGRGCSIDASVGRHVGEGGFRFGRTS